MIGTFSFDDVIFKLGVFFDEYICLLEKNSLKIFDSSFTNQILSINKDKDYTNYCLFGKQGLVFMKKGIFI